MHLPPDRKQGIEPKAFRQRLSERRAAMSLLNYRAKPDRRAGVVLIAVFVLGILGASLAAAMNGGEPPQSVSAIMHLTKVTAPL
jgi:hypothetical protein